MKIRKIICALLALTFCLTIVGCSDKPDDVPEGYKLVSGDRLAYRFYAPEAWQINTGTDQNSVFYSLEDDSKVLISLDTKNPETDVEAYWDNFVNGELGLIAVFNDYTFIESEPAVLGGKDAVSYTFSISFGSEIYKMKMVIAPHGNFFYALTYTSTPENFDKHLEDVRGMMEHLVIA